MPSRSNLAAGCLALVLAVGLAVGSAEAGEVEKTLDISLRFHPE